MNELLLILLQIGFIILLFNYSIYDAVDKFKIKYMNVFEKFSINIIFFINIILFLSLINLNISSIFLITTLISIFCIFKNIKNKELKMKKDISYVFCFILITFLISIDLASSLNLGWDVKYFYYQKTLNFYQNNTLSNLRNLIIPDYPHVGALVWSLFWKYPFNYSEYFGRIAYILIYLSSIFTFFYSLKIKNLIKFILIFLTIIITYDYLLISGLQEILVFSLVLLASKFAYYLFIEKNYSNKLNLIYFILLITNAACWIKNEGLIFLIILNFSLIVFSKIDSQLKLRLFFGSVIIIIARLIFFVFFDTNFVDSQGFDLGKILANFNFLRIISDIKIILFYYCVYLTQLPIYLIFIPVFISMLIYEKKNFPIKKFILSFSILNFLFLIIAFVFAFEDVEWQVRSGLKRFMFETAGFYLLPILHMLNKKKLNK